MIWQEVQRGFWSLYGRYVWDKHRPPWKQAQIERVVNTLTQYSQGSDSRVLDAGCGTGECALALANAGFDVVGVDFAPGMLFRSQGKITPATEGRLSFRQMSLDNALMFGDEAFDYVINISVLQVTLDPKFTLQELCRVLRDGGILYLLHVPKPDYHDWTLWDLVRFRIDHSDSISAPQKLLIAAKALPEWLGKGRYWTVVEVGTMIRNAGFEIINVQAEPVIIIEARKQH